MWHKVTEKDLLKITAKICVHDTWKKKTGEQVKLDQMQNSIASTRHPAPPFCQLDKEGNWKCKSEKNLWVRINPVQSVKGEEETQNQVMQSEILRYSTAQTQTDPPSVS